MAEWWDKETRAAVERVGKNVRLMRVERDMKQETVALETGMARSHVSQLERGKVAPSFHTLLRLSKLFGIPPADLLRGIRG